jgi:hypothetical protein
MKNTSSAILILCLLSSLSHFSPLQEKESISGQNLIDNLLNFGLIKNPLPKKI